ncbi:MAG: ABC transporter permease [Oscillospiraceae bacterium]|nr:ABC transporter permease [Oscillospiraceae bacterium]
MGLFKAFINILRCRTRSLLTMSGIAIGVLSVVLISTVGTVGTAQVNSTLVTMGVDTLLVQAAENSVSVQLTDNSISAARRVDGVTDVMPLMATISEAKLIGSRLDAYIWGVDRSADKLISLSAKHGRLITGSDTAARSKVCVIDEAFALETYGRSNITGKHISLFLGGRYHEFEIIGIASTGLSGLQSMLTNIMPGFMYIPITTMQSLCGRSTYDKLAVKIKDMNNDGTVVENVKAALDTAGGCKDGYIINNLLSQKKQLDDILMIVTISLSLVAGISLVVSGISVMTTMMMSVGERTHEIGIKKSIGAKNSDICIEFLTESVLLTLMGSTAGIISGLVISLVGCLALGVPFSANWTALWISTAAAAVIGAVFGAYPAYKAATMKPVEALRM